MSFVPSRRLLLLVFYAAMIGVGAGPFAALVPVWLGALGLILIAALVDVALTQRRVRTVTVSAPAVLRCMRDRAGEVPLTFHNADGRARRLRIGLGLPAEVEAGQDTMFVDLPAAVPRARVAWPCTPRRRGRHGGVVVGIEQPSTLGWWQVRERVALATEFRVHPNLFAERRHIAALFLPRGQAGIRVQRTLGRGREFEKLREYLPGDGFDEVHWKATAKRGRPVTKVFQAERTQEIHVVIDASRLSARPLMFDGVEQTALERYVAAALVLLLAAGRQGDRFGLMAFDDRLRVHVRAGIGSHHYAACREAVLGLRSSEATPDVPEMIRSLKMRLRQRALVFILTDLSDPVLAEEFARHIRVLSRQHLVVVGHLASPGIQPLFAGPDIRGGEELYGRLAGHTRWAETRRLAQSLRPLGVTHLTLENEAMAAQLVTQYMKVKARQAL